MTGPRSWVFPLLGFALILLIVAIFAGFVVYPLSRSSSSSSEDVTQTTSEPSVAQEIGKGAVGDSKDSIRVVLVDVRGRQVPCVLYDGYRAVAIDCLEGS